jgi:hypothetical protein
MKRPEPKGISKDASIADKIKWAAKGAAKDTAKNAVSLVVPEVKAGAAAAKIGDRVAQKVAETTKAGRYGSAGGKEVTKKVSEKTPVEVTRTTDKTKVTTYNPKDVKYATRERSHEERLGSQKAQDTKRATLIEGASKAGTEAAEPEVKKLADAGTKLANAYRGVDAAKTVVKGTQANHHVTDSKNHTRVVKGD